MNKTMEHNEEVVIDMQRLLKSILERIWFVLLSALAGAVLFLLITVFGITPKYEASAMFYVNNNALSVGEASFSISSSDITASKSLVDSYIVILQTRETLNDVMDYAGVNRSLRDVLGMISAASVNGTEIFEVVVTSTDPQEAELLADAIAYILPKRISSIIEGTSAKVVDAAVMPVKPSSPNHIINTALGFAIGLVLSVTVVVLMETLDVRIRTEEDISRVAKYPMLTTVPDMMAPSKGGYYGNDAKKGKYNKAQGPSRGKGQAVIGPAMPFVAAEAYKLLRTKLQFSFADVEGCRVLGVSSAMSGEGKSMTSVNLAYSLSELNNRVLLIDCDMRRPSVSVKLPISKTPGLSNFLSGQVGAMDICCACNIPTAEEAFAVIPAGNNPPNPVELLSSVRMQRLIEYMRTQYDYIILDLPPVGEVSDAMVSAKLADGMLLVIRQNYCDRLALSDAVRQFEFVDTKILGFVYNFVTESSGAYGKKYYKKYYSSKYESSYNAVMARNKKNSSGTSKDKSET